MTRSTHWGQHAQIDPPPEMRPAQWPSISLITPSYNQAQFIEQTLQSVHDQNYPNLEHIVVDGQSTDGTIDILEQWRDRIESTGGTLIIEPDNGQTQAINKGLQRARGDIVGWLCSDDCLLPNSLHIMGRAFAHWRDCDWIAGSVVTTQADGTPIETQRPHGIFTLAGVLAAPGRAGFQLPQPGVMWRRQAMLELGFLRENLHHCMDFEWWLRLMGSGRSPRLIDHDIATYRLHEASKTCSASTKFMREHLLVEPTYLDHLSGYALRRARKRLAYYERLTALREHEDQPWRLLLKHPWWIASPDIRRALYNRAA